MIRIALLIAVLGFSQVAMAGKLQCWTDEKGQRACGDRVPPQYAKGERKVLDSQGRVTAIKEREKTPEEVAEAQRQRAAQQAEAERLKKQTAYDQYLLQTYANVAEMEGVRDTRVRTLEGRLELAEKAVVDNEASLKTLKERLAKQPADKPNVPLQKQVTQFEGTLVDNLKAVAQLKTERGNVAQKFDSDIRRYKQLRAGEIAMGSPDVPPEPAAP